MLPVVKLSIMHIDSALLMSPEKQSAMHIPYTKTPRFPMYIVQKKRVVRHPSGYLYAIFPAKPKNNA
jgi:hypothetical protein